jgi:hypothetical protein
MSDPVPAIAEASATGAVAEIFADIRTVLGVEVVNLIWRHLATIPDALPWAWGMLRPLYADGTIRSEARALHTRIALPHLPDRFRLDVRPFQSAGAAFLVVRLARAVARYRPLYPIRRCQPVDLLNLLRSRLGGDWSPPLAGQRCLRPT